MSIEYTVSATRRGRDVLLGSMSCDTYERAQQRLRIMLENREEDWRLVATPFDKNNKNIIVEKRAVILGEN